MERLHSQLGAGQRPAPGALMRAGASAEELRLKEERLEQERAAQRKREAEAKRKAEVRIAGHCSPKACHLHCLLYKEVKAKPKS
jgi:hypothetical protein